MRAQMDPLLHKAITCPMNTVSPIPIVGPSSTCLSASTDSQFIDRSVSQQEPSK